jgi:DNA helicase-2/ATP-dependent DNA helicase PcrA
MTTSIDFLSHLNPSQRQAVEHYCGPLLVVAGAGSGKTRALTYRIANLILRHRVAPENILAVTFTNKAAREMKERIQRLFAEQLAMTEYGKRFDLLTEYEQTKLRSQVYRTTIKDLWCGTFHSLFSRILRFDIEKFADEKGRKWNRNFSIFDESDVQALIKEITKQLNLDDKKFEPRSVRYAISNAKNQGLSPQQFETEQPNYRGRVIANVYSVYQDKLAENNSLDFDDLILATTRLFQQNEQVLDYWHRKFRHILVDEYQDTNRTQYELIRLLVTNGENSKSAWQWENRSVFVVGDADQSIYSFRMADFTILLEFQQDFGDGLADEDTRTMVKLEENYRSCENILQAANELIENNTQRIDKILKPTRGAGEQIHYHKADDELSEAAFVVNQIRTLSQQNPELNWGSFAILYRTNAQSRPFEELLVKNNIPYTVVGGMKFYDRKEIKDVIAYLRAIANPADTVSLLRVINTPRRGIGKTTIDSLVNAAQQLGTTLWEILSDETSVNTLAGRATKAVNSFAQMICRWQEQMGSMPVTEVLQGILEDSGYVQDLLSQGTDEAEDRVQNVKELYNAALQFQEENEDVTLQVFLQSAALSSDLDNLKEGETAVSLMTLHSSKGLEFPVVFLVGLEQGLFPNYRSLQDPATLEEERRLCYVGITRAQERLFLSHARERRLYGSREPAVRSQFLEELPEEVLAPRRKSSRTSAKGTSQTWQVGDKVLHKSFGPGEITHVFGEGNKLSVAIKFVSLGQKIVDPRVAQLQKVD